MTQHKSLNRQQYLACGHTRQHTVGTQALTSHGDSHCVRFLLWSMKNTPSPGNFFASQPSGSGNRTRGLGVVTDEAVADSLAGPRWWPPCSRSADAAAAVCVNAGEDDVHCAWSAHDIGSTAAVAAVADDDDDDDDEEGIAGLRAASPAADAPACAAAPAAAKASATAVWDGAGRIRSGARDRRGPSCALSCECRLCTGRGCCQSRATDEASVASVWPDCERAKGDIT